MKIEENNFLKEKIDQYINSSNYWIYILLVGVIILSPVFFYSVRELFGLLPLLISISVLFILFLLRFSLVSSKNFISVKRILSIILLNISLFITLGAIEYSSSSSFSFDYSFSGKYGELLAKGPFYWNNFSAEIINYVDLSIRISIPLFLIIFINYPKRSKEIISIFLIKIIYFLSSNFKKISFPRIKIKKYNTSKNNNEETLPETNIKEKIIISEKIIEKPIEDIIDKTKEITINKSINRDEVIKEIIYDENSNIDKELDKFLIKEHKWPKIKTEDLKTTPKTELNKNEINDTIEIIKSTLSAHGVNTSIENYTSGPSVTMYQLKPGYIDGKDNKRVKVEQVLRREKDLALALGSPNIRFEAVLDGVQNIMGVEIPNITPNTVDFKDVIDSKEIKKLSTNFALPAPLGQGMDGNPIIIDLAKMPHLLVAGSTGSGKSVFINSVITGLITKKTPDEIRMILIDPKRVELTPYSDIPHLYTDEVIVDTEKAVSVLSSTVTEMMNRFKVLEKVGVKNISDFNTKMNKTHKMWNLLIVIDELADLMLQAGSEIERLIVRLAQLGRATGIHLVVATQRPSVDVVTGLIKANFPSRVSFAVMSQIDSRTVLDSVGAEKLIGKGDMLFSPIDNAQMSRIQGVFLSENDIENITKQWEGSLEKYSLEMLKIEIEEKSINKELSGDSLYDQALELSSQSNTLSTSLLQRRLRIGYPRAARLMDELEDKGIVGPGEAGKPRKILI
ncbi:MAG: DNA translocase FtsK [Dehalococcoidia bacterium]|nr:DNA translocase FtsK [Dehalococcoidia bacterium]